MELRHIFLSTRIAERAVAIRADVAVATECIVHLQIVALNDANASSVAHPIDDILQTADLVERVPPVPFKNLAILGLRVCVEKDRGGCVKALVFELATVHRGQRGHKDTGLRCSLASIHGKAEAALRIGRSVLSICNSLHVGDLLDAASPKAVTFPIC